MEVTKDGSRQIILEADYLIKNIYVVNKVIIIQMCKAKYGVIYTKNIPSNVFGYKIKIDSSMTESDCDLSEVPDFIKNNNSKIVSLLCRFID